MPHISKRRQRSDPRGWLTSTQAAALFKVGPKTFIRWHQEGHLDGKVRIITTLGGHRRVSEADLLALRQRLTHQVGEVQP